MKRPVCSVGLMFAVACAGSEDKPTPPAAVVIPVVIETTMLPQVDLRASYDHKIAVSGGVPPYAFAIADGTLPADIALMPGAGTLIGVANAPGPFVFTIRVTDSVGTAATQALTIYVKPDRLDVATSSVPAGQETIPYEFSLMARGGVPPFTWTMLQGTLPAGITFTSAGVLAGVATEFGVYAIDVEVEDTEGKQARASFDLLWRSLEPMIRTSAIPRARSEVTYEAQLVAQGGLPPYSWTVSDGALPAGVELMNNGRIRGLPTEYGGFTFRVHLSDASGRTDEVGLLLDVIPPLTIVTTAVTAFVRGRNQSFTLAANGGVGPYTWTMTGLLATGLSFAPNGTISGTADQAGDFEIIVRVRDAEAVEEAALFTVRVIDRFIYRVDPMLPLPTTCTGTTVIYARAQLNVQDSLQIADLEVSVDVDFRDDDGRNNNDKLKLTLFAPDGTQTPLCGNAAGVRGAGGCAGSGGVNETFGVGNPPERPLAAHFGTNPQGAWTLAMGVARPTTDPGGNCEQTGIINSFSLLIDPDVSGQNYVFVRGFKKNNLSIDPHVRLGVLDHELFLSATVYSVGINGLPEGGAGDDVPQNVDMTWRLSAATSVATVTPDGHVQAGTETGMGTLTSTGTGVAPYSTPLRVFAPDWNPLTRQF